MSNLFTSVPSSKNKTASYRRIIKSSDFNEKEQRILSDLLELYNKSNSLNENLQNAVVNLDYENKFLKRKLDYLEGKLKEQINNGNLNKLTIFPSDIKSNKYYPVEINHMSYDMSQDIIKRISKINIYDEAIDKTIVPSSLNVEYKILNKTNSFLKFNSNNILNAFNNDNSTSWIYKITTNNSVNSVLVEVVITIPQSIITSYDVNEIIIEPFPTSSVNIKELQYRSSYNNWTDIPSFTEHYEYDNDCIKESTVTRFNFKSVNASQIRIVLEQTYFFNKNNLREFCIGAKNIQINYIKHTNKECFFEFTLDIPKRINNPILSETKIVYNNPSQIDNNVIELEYFYKDLDDILHKINGQFPLSLPSNKIEVKGKIYQDDNAVNLSHIDFFISEQ